MLSLPRRQLSAPGPCRAPLGGQLSPLWPPSIQHSIGNITDLNALPIVRNRCPVFHASLSAKTCETYRIADTMTVFFSEIMFKTRGSPSATTNNNYYVITSFHFTYKLLWIISHSLYRTGGSNYEFVEMYNPSDESLDMTDVSVLNEGPNPHSCWINVFERIINILIAKLV